VDVGEQVVDKFYRMPAVHGAKGRLAAHEFSRFAAHGHRTARVLRARGWVVYSMPLQEIFDWGRGVVVHCLTDLGIVRHGDVVRQQGNRALGDWSNMIAWLFAAAAFLFLSALVLMPGLMN
jgi:hypothetical protein